jgi:hypothetical protein
LFLFLGLARHFESAPRSYKSAALPTELRQQQSDRDMTLQPRLKAGDCSERPFRMQLGLFGELGMHIGEEFAGVCRYSSPDYPYSEVKLSVPMGINDRILHRTLTFYRMTYSHDEER